MFEDNNRTAKYDKFTHRTMIHEIHLDHHLEWLILHNRLIYAENMNKISGSPSHVYDTNISKSFLAVVRYCQYINDIKMIDIILNPFFSVTTS